MEIVAPGGDVRISKDTAVVGVGVGTIVFLGRKASQAPRAMDNNSTAGAPNLNQGAPIQDGMLEGGALVATFGAAFGTGLAAAGPGGDERGG